LIGVPDYRQESLRCKQRVRLSAAQLGHPFTHRRCPLRHEFTGPPRRADSSPFRYLPAAVAHDVPAPAEIREDASRQSLQPTMLSKRAPCVSTDSRATSSHPRDPRCLCAPQFRIAPAPWAWIAPSSAPHSRADSEVPHFTLAPAHCPLWFYPTRTATPASSRGAVGAATASCVLIPTYPPSTNRVGRPHTLLLRSGLGQSPRRPVQPQTQARRNRPLTLLVTPPGRRPNEFDRSDGARSHELDSGLLQSLARRGGLTPDCSSFRPRRLLSADSTPLLPLPRA
jgi:hypothetical protein